MGVVKTQVQGVRLRGVWLVCQTLRRGRVEKHDAAAIAQRLKGTSQGYGKAATISATRHAWRRRVRRSQITEARV